MQKKEYIRWEYYLCYNIQLNEIEQNFIYTKSVPARITLQCDAVNGTRKVNDISAPGVMLTISIWEKLTR